MKVGVKQHRDLSTDEIRRTLEEKTREGGPIKVAFMCTKNEHCSPRMSVNFSSLLKDKDLSTFFKVDSQGWWMNPEEVGPGNPAPFLASILKEFDVICPLMPVRDDGSNPVPKRIEEAMALIEPASRPKLVPFIVKQAKENRGKLLEMIEDKNYPGYSKTLQNIVRAIR